MTLPDVWRRVRAHRLIATAIVAVLLFAMMFVSVPPVRHTVESKLPRMPWSPKLTSTTPLWPNDPRQRTAIVATPDGGGFWQLQADGSVYSAVDAPFLGGLGQHPLQAPQFAYGMARTPSGLGYWLVGGDGSVWAYGDANFTNSNPARNAVHGPIVHNAGTTIVGITSSPSGLGYWEVGSDGGTFDYGDAVFKGSEAGHPLNAPVVGVASSPDGSGFWMVAADGGVFAEGAPPHGGFGDAPPFRPVVAMAPTPSSGGYWLVTSDGAIYTKGDAPQLGNIAAQGISTTVIGLAATHTGRGYWMLQQDHTVYAFGDAGTMQ